MILFERFLKLCAGRIGQLLNVNSLATEAGVDHKTASSWLSILEASFVLHRVMPHHKNFNKRLVKMAKLYFYDTGLVCALLGIESEKQIVTHPLRGALFENLCINQFIKRRTNLAKVPNVFFWRDSLGKEVDILLENGLELYPIEVKSSYTLTKNYFKGLEYWTKLSGQQRGAVIYSGDQNQLRSNGLSAYSWKSINEIGS